MTSYPILRFVDAPNVAATIRNDLQAAPAMVLADGVSLGAPALDGETEAVGRAWGYRQIRLTQLLEGTHDQVVPLVTALARELMRPRNWLQFQLSAFSQPVWFRTWLTQPGEIDYEYVYNDELGASCWQISVAVDADPFAYGAQVVLPAVTLGNDCSAGTNPTLYVLPPVMGDAPAPLRLRVSPVRESATAMVSVLASDAQPTSYVIPVAVGTSSDTTAGVADATASGGSKYVTTFATTTNMLNRVLWSGPVVKNATYKLYARMKTTVAGSTYKLSIYDQYTTPKTLAGATVTTMATGWEWFDLGTLDWPTGALIDGDEFLLPSTTLSGAFAAQRLSGTGNLELDCVLFIPIDISGGHAETMLVTWPSCESTPQGAYVDTESRSVRLVSSGDQPYQASVSATVVGEFPHVTPGVQNVLRMLATFTTPPGDDITSTATLVMSYYPRWLYLAGT